MSALTTFSVSCAVNSRTRAEAALWPPLTARNALVTAMAIFDGSKPTTAPLRRITLYCASRGSALAASGILVSPAICLGVDMDGGMAEELVTCMVRTPQEILWLLIRNNSRGQKRHFHLWSGLPSADSTGGQCRPGPPFEALWEKPRASKSTRYC